MSSDTYTGETGWTDSLTENDRHRLLASDRRRVALEILAESRVPIDFEGMAAEIAEREAGSETVDEATVERVAVDLHHVHLPLMAELGVVDYDLDSRRVNSDGPA